MENYFAALILAESLDVEPFIERVCGRLKTFHLFTGIEVRDHSVFTAHFIVTEKNFLISVLIVVSQLVGITAVFGFACTTNLLFGRRFFKCLNYTIFHIPVGIIIGFIRVSNSECDVIARLQVFYGLCYCRAAECALDVVPVIAA